LKKKKEAEESELLGMSWGSSKFGRSRMHGLGEDFLKKKKKKKKNLRVLGGGEEF
jgi:hypothetical protein